MKSALRRAATLVAVAMLVACLVPGVAYADLDSWPTPLGTTLTNPDPPLGDPSYVQDWWRMGWGKSLSPQLTWNAPLGFSASEGVILGQLYQVDRDASLDVSSTMPWLYSANTFGNTGGGSFGTNFDTTYDLLGIYANGAGSWPATETGVANVIEGTWWIHAKYYSTLRYSTLTMDVPLKIDITAPDPVTGLQIATGVGKPAIETTTWVPTTRAHLTWDDKTYDSLSGVGYYKFLLDGASVDATVQGRVYDLPGHPTPHSWTIESMPPGKHKVSVVCVDRATNESTESSSVYFYSDPDTPTVSFVSPAGGFLNSKTIVSVDASDKAGDPIVTFAFDGVATATVSAPPYTFKPKLTGVSTGTHTITATATDRYGRSVTATKSVSTIAASSGFQPDDTGLLDVMPSGTTLTNPNIGDVAWRKSWGNSLRPQFTINIPSIDTSLSGNVIGLLYTVDKRPDTEIDISRPDLYNRSAHGAGTEFDETIDLQGVIAYPPFGGWPTPAPNENSVAEGFWYVHFVMFTDQGYAGTVTQSIPFGIDLTKPRALVGLRSSPTTDPADGGVWTEVSRAHVTWNAMSYDDLASVAYYQCYIDGVKPQTASAGRIEEVEGKTPASLTIENMPSGTHKISIAAIDRAGNVGPLAHTYFYSDPDVPAIKFGTFSRTVGTRPTFKVIATDAGGIREVVYRLDGNVLGHQTSSPYSISPSLSGYSSGAHTLTATVVDMFGRAAVVTTTITLDKTPLVLSSFSRTPSIFYPIIHDGYRDFSHLTFRLNKAASIVLTVKNSKGTTIRTLKKSGVAGTNRMTWNGKYASDGLAHTGLFTYQLTAKDSVGNTAKSVKLTTRIRNYQLVRTSSGGVKVIPR